MGIVLLALPAAAQDLHGVIDLHVHSNPDSVARFIDAVDAASFAAKQGMRGMLFKNHYEPTASLAYLVRKAVPGFEAFGGIALNLSVGGLNVHAIDHAAKVEGHFARVVWMPTFDAENNVRVLKENRAFVPISKDGALLPATVAVMRAIAAHQLVLATGHSSPSEVLMLIRAAKSVGIQQVLVTHPMHLPVNMTVPQMKEAASLGAVLEYCFLSAEFDSYAKAIREVGPEHCVLSSDLGRADRVIRHGDGLLQFMRELRKRGITESEIDLMTRSNPAKLMGLGRK
jgi:hypothetical protein